jgi:hypothetical protein
MYYVTMTDKHLSGWGLARDKKNKLIFSCETLNEAQIVSDNAENQGSMKYINICYKKPYYSSASYYVQEKDKEEYPSWYESGYFRGRN